MGETLVTADSVLEIEVVWRTAGFIFTGGLDFFDAAGFLAAVFLAGVGAFGDARRLLLMPSK